MSEDTTQTDSELFDATDESESGSDAESTTGDEETQSEGEEIKHTKAENERQKQIDTFTRRVKSGEITIEKIPHQWIKDEVAKALIVKEPDVSELVKKAIKEEKETEKYATLREKLNEANLTDVKRQKVTQEYQDLLDAGLSKAKALEKAILIAGVKLEDDRFAARIPKIANKADPESNIKESLAEGEVPGGSADERINVYEKLRKNK